MIVTAGVAGCGGDEVTVPTAEELGAALVVVDDVDGTWTVNAGPSDSPMPESGVIPEELRGQLPTLELCDLAPAEAQAAADGVVWLAYRQLDQEEDDPIELPADRTGHLVFVQEYLTAGEPEELSATFDALLPGFQACLGEQPAGEEGPAVTEELALPEVGDQRYGELTVMAEAGGWAEWHIAAAVVRDDAVLMSFVLVDIVGGDVEPAFTAAQFGEMVETAVARW
jgi:hypothetical protein